jgi:hypothetical protein
MTTSAFFGDTNLDQVQRKVFIKPWILARPEGLEPPTPWFVARYSIQLSYGRIAMAEREGFEPSMEFSAPYSLSRGVPSATRPSLQRISDN